MKRRELVEFGLFLIFIVILAVGGTGAAIAYALPVLLIVVAYQKMTKKKVLPA